MNVVVKELDPFFCVCIFSTSIFNEDCLLITSFQIFAIADNSILFICESCTFNGNVVGVLCRSWATTNDALF